MFEVITGPMFSGKTEELIRRIKRAHIAGQQTLLVKPMKDDRYEGISTHDGLSFAQNVLYVDETQDLEVELPKRVNADVVGVDEAQFFNESLIPAIENLFRNGTRVIVCGLDMDYSTIGFGIMPELMARAKTVDKFHSVCHNCGNDAWISLPIGNKGGVGNHYRVLCEHCYVENH